MRPAEEYALNAPEAGSGAEPSLTLEEVFRAQYPGMVRVLSRLTGDRSRAEDIAADVFCRLARRPALFRPGDLTAWFCRAAINAGLDALRSEARRRRREGLATAEALQRAEEPGALESLLQNERRARVREALADLKPRDAQILLLRSSGLAYREIAQALGVAPGSVGTLLARAETEFEKRFLARNGGAR